MKICVSGLVFDKKIYYCYTSDATVSQLLRQQKCDSSGFVCFSFRGDEQEFHSFSFFPEQEADPQTLVYHIDLRDMTKTAEFLRSIARTETNIDFLDALQESAFIN